jgi:transcriptional regulator with XRE-family HTH domain
MLTGERIKLLRLLKGVAQYDIAAGTGSQQSYSDRFESLGTTSEDSSLQRVAAALDTTPEWLEEGRCPVFTRPLLIADPVPNALPASARSGIIADLKGLLPSFFSTNYISECVTILVSPGVITNILLFPEGSLLVLIARNRAVKIIQSAIKRSGCICSFLDLSKSSFNIDRLLEQEVEQGAEALRELLEVAATAMSNTLDVTRYVREYRENAQQDRWEFCLTAYVSKKGGLTREQAMEAMHRMMILHKVKDVQIEITRMV